MSGSGCTTGTEADNGSVWICGQQTICSNQTANGGHEFQVQTVLVTAVSGTCSSSCTVTISPGLYMQNWAYARTPTMTWNSTSFTAIGVGLEDLTIDFTAGTSSNNGTFAINQAYAVWVKGVRFIGSNASACCGLFESGFGNSLFMNNYYFATNPLTAHINQTGLPIEPTGFSSVLFLNNFVQGGGISSMEEQGFNSGNVYAYNYFRDNNTSQVYAGDAEHSASPNFELREGDVYSESEDDATWGTHNFDSWFRNRITCYDPPFIGEAAPRGLLMDNYARFGNAVGNVLNESGKCTGYKGTAVGDEFQFGSSDSLAQSTSMLWGNYDTINAAVQWNSSEVPSNLPSPNTAYSNPLPSSHSLPASFFMDSMTAHPSGGTGLSYWQVCTTWTTFPTSCSATQIPPMPPIGPDVTGGPYANGYGYDIPAAIAYKNLPIDTTYQNSYTVTSSSWSGGTETLTMNGLPTGSIYVMGGFQLSGAASVCAPTSGVSYTGRSDGEVLMTGSSTTTISYALASNPNTSCTGTLKWPDVRQFDERVYENDAAGGPPPQAPTGLQAVVN
ncbi:MAG: hypothetical protein WBV60_15650 [Terriglobales bacterium]